MMTCMDILIFSLMVIFGNFMGPNESAGQVIILNIISILYSIPLGFASGTCALVGRNIGKGNVAKARMYARQSVFLVVAVSLTPCILLGTIPSQIISVFTSDQLIINTCIMAMRVSVIGFMFDALQATMQGVVKGIELQSRAWYASTLNYVVGVPLGCALGFVAELKLAGLWIGVYSA